MNQKCQGQQLSSCTNHYTSLIYEKLLNGNNIKENKNVNPKDKFFFTVLFALIKLFHTNAIGRNKIR